LSKGKFLKIPVDGANLYIELEPNVTPEALGALGAEVKPNQHSGDFINRYSLNDTSSKIIESSI